ncbi:MAG: hypothetical protein AAF447_05920 [Myxococcota bacterium]
MTRVSLALGLLLLGASAASAQQDPFAQPTQPPPPPPPSAVPVQQQPAPLPPVQQAPVAQRGARQISLFIPLTIWAQQTDLLTLGGGVGARFGWEFNSLVPQLEVGIHVNPVDGADATLNNSWFGAGARYQFLNESRFVPFAEAMLRFNFFSLVVDTGVAFVESTTELLFGVHVGGGVIIEITRRFSFDAQLNVHFVFDSGSDLFVTGFDSGSTQTVIEPRFGGTFYF